MQFSIFNLGFFSLLGLFNFELEVHIKYFSSHVFHKTFVEYPDSRAHFILVRGIFFSLSLQSIYFISFSFFDWDNFHSCDQSNSYLMMKLKISEEIENYKFNERPYRHMIDIHYKIILGLTG